MEGITLTKEQALAVLDLRNKITDSARLWCEIDAMKKAGEETFPLLMRAGNLYVEIQNMEKELFPNLYTVLETWGKEG